MTATKAPDDVLRRIRQGNRFLLTSHVNPDGDSIGSALGLARLLRGMGKGAVVWNRDEPPAVYRALPGADRIHSGAEPPAGFPEKFDAIVVLECPSADRTGLEEHLDALPVVNVDHHLGNQHYGEINWVDPAAPAVGEMVYRLAQALKLTLDHDTANCLYLTLVTDTGGFRYSNATAAAFEAAASLVRSGAQPDLVARWLYESRSEGSLRLLAELLGTMELHAGGRVATARITQEMYQRTGTTPGDAEGLINYPRSVAGVEAVALARELPEGGAKVSLRSRGEVDVEQVARRHGGGGHRNAAGYQVESGVEAALAQAVEALAEAVSRPAPETVAVEPAAGPEPGAAEATTES
ncbi:MAG TPA: bifunctional oligoribonuclease/PAP phosphatase NrnA [Thermoanaerobaculia bacterium]|nr:bifunctional oligoribonuclease/PAP phosphatase NrnA [Thermoanaerobaculia bacterium]